MWTDVLDGCSTGSGDGCFAAVLNRQRHCCVWRRTGCKLAICAKPTRLLLRRPSGQHSSHSQQAWQPVTPRTCRVSAVRSQPLLLNQSPQHSLWCLALPDPPRHGPRRMTQAWRLELHSHAHRHCGSHKNQEITAQTEHAISHQFSLLGGVLPSLLLNAQRMHASWFRTRKRRSVRTLFRQVSKRAERTDFDVRCRDCVDCHHTFSLDGCVGL